MADSISRKTSLQYPAPGIFWVCFIVQRHFLRSSQCGHDISAVPGYVTRLVRNTNLESAQPRDRCGTERGRRRRTVSAGKKSRRSFDAVIMDLTALDTGRESVTGCRDQDQSGQLSLFQSPALRIASQQITGPRLRRALPRGFFKTGQLDNRDAEGKNKKGWQQSQP